MPVASRGDVAQHLPRQHREFVYRLGPSRLALRINRDQRDRLRLFGRPTLDDIENRI